MTAVVSLAFVSQAFALPQGGQVVDGQATITSSGGQTTINQSTQRGIINWQSFDIAHGEAVHFQQPSASSVTLNRVTGGQGASQILGNLTANGTVMLVNPQGTFIGPNANVNVGSFVATTSDIADDRFMTGDYRFDRPGRPDAAIINTGSITVADAGLAALVAPNVVNNGLIQARLGKVQLASGDTFTLDLYGDGLFALEAGPTITSQLVSNGGIIAAEGGKVLITAAAAGEVVNSLINMDGIISATSIGEQNGEIVIFAEGSNAVAGNDTAKKGQKQGNSTVLVSGVLDASGRGEGERGGKITVTGDNVALLSGTIIDASGHTGLSGTTVGKAVSAHRDGSAGGDIRIGGDYLGQGDTPTARNLYVDPGALIVNDALFTGDAGRTIFWSDGNTQFYGNVYARALGGMAVDNNTWSATAGGTPGDGGFVETSGYEHLDAGGYVDLTASNGSRGTYFLDPTDITIYGNVDPAFVSTDGSIDLATSLRLWLDASDTSKVTLTYSTDGLSSATATGTAGSNTITTSTNVSANLAVGARIRLGAAGAVTNAATLGADTYTIASINGTTITLTHSLTQNYSGSTLHRGLVSQLTDKSGLGNNATQATAVSMPLWVSNGRNGQAIIRFTNDFLTLSQGIGSATGFSLFLLSRPENIANNPGFAISTDIGGQSAKIGPWNGGLFVRIVDNSSVGTATWSPGDSYSILNVNRSGTNQVTYGFNGSTPQVLLTNQIGSSDYIRIGAAAGTSGNSTQHFVGDIPEVIHYDATLHSSARSLVEQYQSVKWAIELTPPGTGATEAAKATAADGYSAFTTRYLERLSQTADISLQATNNITLDLKGDTLALAANRNLTLTAGNDIQTASAGTITVSGAGTVSFNAGRDIVVAHPLTINSGTGSKSFTAGRDIAFNASVVGTGNSSFSNSAGRNLLINAPFSASRALLKLAGTGGTGTISINANISAGSGVDFRAANDVSVNNATVSGQTIALRASNNNINGTSGRLMLANALFTPADTGFLHLVSGSNGGVRPDIVVNNSVLPTNPRELRISGFNDITISKTLTSSGNGNNQFDAARYLTFNNPHTFGTTANQIFRGAGGVFLNADLTKIADGGNFTLSGPVTVSGNRTVSAVGGAVTFDGTVNGTSGGTDSLSVSSGAGAVTFSSMVGATNSLNNLSVTSTSQSFGGNLNATHVFLLSANSLNLPSITAASILARTTGGTSDLTIAAGKSLTASGSGNAITLASGRHFINNSGAGALTTPSGRWLVYSTNPANDTIGGLTNGFRRFSCTYGGSCPSFPADGNGFLYSHTPTLTATPSGVSIAYGDAAPNLSGYSYTLSGYLGSDSGSDSVTGSLTGSTPYTQGSNVGSYAVNYGSGSLASSMGYAFTYANGASAITVSPRTLTASLTGTVRKTFNGTAAATLAPANYLLSGLLAGDSVSLNNPTSGIFNNSEVGVNKLVTVTGLALLGADSGNYLLNSPVVSASIGRIDPAIAATDAARINLAQQPPLPGISFTTNLSDAPGSIHVSYGGPAGTQPAGAPAHTFQDLAPQAGVTPVRSLPNGRVKIDVDPLLQWFFSLPPSL